MRGYRSAFRPHKAMTAALTGRANPLRSTSIFRSAAGISVPAIRKYATVENDDNSGSRPVQDGKQPQNVYTTISDEADPQRRQFFEFTRGSWIKNDVVEKAKRYTAFSIAGLSDVIYQLHNSRYDGGLSEIESFYQGSSHRLYRVKMKNGGLLILRLPYHTFSSDYLSLRIKSEAATIDFAEKKLNLKVPKLLQWSSDSENPLKHEFMLFEYIEGSNMGWEWNEIGQIKPEESPEKRQAEIAPLMKSLAETSSSFLDIKFNKFGSLYFKNDVPKELQKELPYEGETDPELQDRWRIGPSVEPKFWHNSIGLNDVARGPWNTAIEYLQDIAAINLKAINEKKSDITFVADPGDEKDFLVRNARKGLECFEQDVSKIVTQVVEEDQRDPEHVLTSPRLYHGQLHPKNMLRLKDGSIALTDWEGSSIIPGFLALYPEEMYIPELRPGRDVNVDGEDSPLGKIYQALRQNLDVYNEQYAKIAESSTQTDKAALLSLASDLSVYSLAKLVHKLDSLTYYEPFYKFNLHLWETSGNITYDSPEDMQNSIKLAVKALQQTAVPTNKGFLPRAMFDLAVQEGYLVKGSNGDYQEKEGLANFLMELRTGNIPPPSS